MRVHGVETAIRHDCCTSLQRYRTERLEARPKRSMRAIVTVVAGGASLIAYSTAAADAAPDFGVNTSISSPSPSRNST